MLSRSRYSGPSTSGSSPYKCMVIRIGNLQRNAPALSFAMGRLCQGVVQPNRASSCAGCTSADVLWGVVCLSMLTPGTHFCLCGLCTSRAVPLPLPRLCPASWCKWQQRSVAVCYPVLLGHHGGLLVHRHTSCKGKSILCHNSILPDRGQASLIPSWKDQLCVCGGGGAWQVWAACGHQFVSAVK